MRLPEMIKTPGGKILSVGNNVAVVNESATALDYYAEKDFAYKISEIAKIASDTLKLDDTNVLDYFTTLEEKIVAVIAIMKPLLVEVMLYNNAGDQVSGMLNDNRKDIILNIGEMKRKGYIPNVTIPKYHIFNSFDNYDSNTAYGLDQVLNSMTPKDVDKNLAHLKSKAWGVRSLVEYYGLENMYGIFDILTPSFLDNNKIEDSYKFDLFERVLRSNEDCCSSNHANAVASVKTNPYDMLCKVLILVRSQISMMEEDTEEVFEAEKRIPNYEFIFSDVCFATIIYLGYGLNEIMRHFANKNATKKFIDEAVKLSK